MFVLGDRVEIRKVRRVDLRLLLTHHRLTENQHHAIKCNDQLPDVGEGVLTGVVCLVDSGTYDACPYIVKFDNWDHHKMYVTEFNLLLIGKEKAQLRLEVDV
ncbi:MAG: hypothetical protein KUG64_10390 [Cycloclasticus sp.]|nr:hypothetical protein [Cycloclasticus sp.]